jgi:thymidylate synthase (FAD)
MSVKLIWITPDAEQVVSYCARVSNPSNQHNTETAPRLLRYLIAHKHWSPFEMASACFEIETSRAISAQILRHRSFSFQEFSQRYAPVPALCPVVARMQDAKNRQGSLPAPQHVADSFAALQARVHADALTAYNEALAMGVAKEQARMLLPMASATRLYMSGTLRSWLHYIDVRCGPETQAEHRELANEIRRLLAEQVPTVIEAFNDNASV